MALNPDYASVAELKAHLRIGDADDDTELGIALTAASRAIDHATNRQFGLATSAVARYYQWDREVLEGQLAVSIDDLMTVTGLVVKLDQGQDGTFELTLTNGTDFDLWPWNAAADSRPWTHLVFRRDAEAFPSRFARELEITAQWGWTEVPTIVQQATLVQASRFFVRRDSPYGVAGSPEIGSEVRLLARLDPDVAMMVSAVRRPWGAV